MVRGGNVYPPKDWGVITQKGKDLYVHILNPPVESFLFLPGFQEKVKSVYSMNPSRKLSFSVQKERAFINLDGLNFDPIDTILHIRLE